MKFTNMGIIARIIADILCRSQIYFDTAQLGITIEHILDRRLRQARCFLCDMGNHPGRWHIQITLVRMQLVAQHREQAGFSTAVSTSQTDFPTRMDLQSGALNKHLDTAH